MRRWALTSDRTITYSQRIRPGIGLSTQQQLDLVDESWARWAEICGINPVRVRSHANVLIWWRSLSSKLLGQAVLPQPNKPMNQRLDLRLNRNIPKWKPYLFIIISSHEIGHVLGIGHLNHANSVMEGRYNPNYTLTEWDIPQAHKRYGDPLPKWLPTPSEDDMSTAARINNKLKLRLASSDTFNARGARERYLRGKSDHHSLNKNGWYFFMPDGGFYAWRGGQGKHTRITDDNSELIHKFGTEFYNNPILLTEAKLAPPGEEDTDTRDVEFTIPGVGSFSGTFTPDQVD